MATKFEDEADAERVEELEQAAGARALRLSSVRHEGLGEVLGAAWTAVHPPEGA